MSRTISFKNRRSNIARLQQKIVNTTKCKQVKHLSNKLRLRSYPLIGSTVTRSTSLFFLSLRFLTDVRLTDIPLPKQTLRGQTLGRYQTT